eukprot:Skav217230  [mRNA]  locus=scaffold3434:83903:88348:- [translate_table: standard]
MFVVSFDHLIQMISLKTHEELKKDEILEPRLASPRRVASRRVARGLVELVFTTESEQYANVKSEPTEAFDIDLGFNNDLLTGKQGAIRTGWQPGPLNPCLAQAAVPAVRTVHLTKEAKLDKSQRKIMQKLSSHQSAALILDYVKRDLTKTDIAGAAELVSCLEDEASPIEAFAGSISPFEFRRLRKTLSQMNVYSLLAVFTSRSSQYSREDRVRVERIFGLVQTIRKQLVLHNVE